MEAHLDMIEDQVLSKFERLETDTSVPRQPRWDKPVCSILKYHAMSKNLQYTFAALIRSMETCVAGVVQLKYHYALSS